MSELSSSDDIALVPAAFKKAEAGYGTDPNHSLQVASSKPRQSAILHTDEKHNHSDSACRTISIA